MKAKVVGDNIYFFPADPKFVKTVHATVIKTAGRQVGKVVDMPVNRRMLRRMGFKILWQVGNLTLPNPYPTIFKHQLHMIKHYLKYPQCINGSEMGTAKTAPTIWTLMNLLLKGDISNVLIVAPKSCVLGVWDNDIRQLFPFEETGKLIGTADKRRKELAKGCRIDIINYHGIKVLDRELRDKCYDLVVIDEVSFYRNYNHSATSHFKTMLAFLKSIKPKVWGIAGDCTPNSPADAWGIARIVYYNRHMPGITAFKHQVMLKVSDFKWVPRSGCEKDVNEILQPTIVYKKDECLDLPPVTIQYRHVPMNTAHAKAFMQLRKDYVYQHMNSDEPISAPNAAVLTNKLLQFSMGVVYDDVGNIVDVGIKERLAELIDLLSNHKGKAAIYAPYKHTLDYIVEAINKARLGKAVKIDGGVSDAKRAKAQFTFNDKKSSSIMYWVAQPDTVSHGLNLVAANLTIWFGPVHSNNTFSQANERYNRPGQTENMTEVRFYSTDFDKAIYDKLTSRQKLSDVVSKYLKGNPL